MTIDLQIVFFIILGFLLIVLIVLAVLILLKISQGRGDDKSMKVLQSYIMDMNRNVDHKMTQTHQVLDKKLSEANKYMSENMSKTFATSTKINEEANKRIEDITKKLTQIEETNKQIKDIGGQLKGLENVLKNPKQRGNLGEYFLKELLENVFNSDQYQTQYTLDDVGIVDAALFIGGRVIPIDAKFPHDNYEKLTHSEDDFSIKKYSDALKKDIKARIDETSKYIVPELNTTDFAFMLIPAEGMYYDLFINKLWNLNPKKLIEYAFSKKVIICSPSSFYAYLQTVLQGMKSLQIEQEAKEIQKYVLKLQKDLQTYEETFQKMWKSLGTTVGHYNDSYKRFHIIDKDIIKITGEKDGSDIQPLSLDKPQLDS